MPAERLVPDEVRADEGDGVLVGTLADEVSDDAGDADAAVDVGVSAAGDAVADEDVAVGLGSLA
ncbi:MAG TPA: hypothetical protein VE442_15400 [Jatrophihabitans sp.]|nr:hypothetical protein [Jatrophihabitans sp.]